MSQNDVVDETQGDEDNEDKEILDEEEDQESEEINKVDDPINSDSNSTVVELDPVAEATKKYENKLQQEVDRLETTLRSERFRLSRAKDKVSESGKNGYFIIQAQVNDFMVLL